jgi:hypothetical protein
LKRLKVSKGQLMPYGKTYQDIVRDCIVWALRENQTEFVLLLLPEVPSSARRQHDRAGRRATCAVKTPWFLWCQVEDLPYLLYGPTKVRWLLL